MRTERSLAAPVFVDNGDIAEADWNVVATAQSGEFNRAMQLLGRFGSVKMTDFFNVLVLKVDDVRAFLKSYSARAREDRRLAECICRIRPVTRVFKFSGIEEFRQKSCKATEPFLSDLEGKSFHVRINRRGMKRELSGQVEEQHLDGIVLRALKARGAPGRIDFDDPDAIVDIETLGDVAGVALWTREEMTKYPFLKVN